MTSTLCSLSKPLDAETDTCPPFTPLVLTFMPAAAAGPPGSTAWMWHGLLPRTTKPQPTASPTIYTTKENWLVGVKSHCCYFCFLTITFSVSQSVSPLKLPHPLVSRCKEVENWLGTPVGLCQYVFISLFMSISQKWKLEWDWLVVEKPVKCQRTGHALSKLTGRNQLFRGRQHFLSCHYLHPAH